MAKKKKPPTITRRVRCIRCSPAVGPAVGDPRVSVAFESADEHDYGVSVAFDVLKDVDGEHPFKVLGEYDMTFTVADPSEEEDEG